MKMKVPKKYFDLDMNKRFSVERSDDYSEWVQIEHAVFRNFCDKTIVCEESVLKLKLAVDMVEVEVVVVAFEHMAHVYASTTTTIKMDVKRNYF